MGSRWGGTEAASVVQATRAAPSGRRMLRGQRFQVTVFQMATLPLTLCDFERVFISLHVSTSGKLGPPPHPQCGEHSTGQYSGKGPQRSPWPCKDPPHPGLDLFLTECAFPFFFFLSFFFFLGPHLQHVEVPRLEAESELQLPACTPAPGKTGSLAH